ncbi:ATP-binding protein, partial [Streptomyces spiramenti]|uniref:ATP-binding protein n=1 Tax=Streptomyces spiramenti TaxID=2720606 RepID=UPI001ADD6D08
MQELRRQLELGPDPAEVRRAREWVRAQLDGGGGPGPGTPADTVVLLVSELVTNAVVHTGRPAVLRLLLPGEAHTHEENEAPEDPSEERDPCAGDRGSAAHRPRLAAGHREGCRQAEPDRQAERRPAAEPGTGEHAGFGFQPGEVGQHARGGDFEGGRGGE